VSPDTVLKRSDRATFQIVADEAIVIHLDTGTYFSLNRVGTEFWQMLDAEQTIRQHANSIAQAYDVDPGMVVEDLIAVAQEMADENLVEVV
jgi:hypothetical protein